MCLTAACSRLVSRCVGGFWPAQVLVIVAASHLDAVTFQICSQAFKILPTAVFAALLLGQKLTGLQWASLPVLAAGIAFTTLTSGSSSPHGACPPLSVHPRPILGAHARLTPVCLHACCQSDPSLGRPHTVMSGNSALRNPRSSAGQPDWRLGRPETLPLPSQAQAFPPFRDRLPHLQVIARRFKISPGHRQLTLRRARAGDGAAAGRRGELLAGITASALSGISSAFAGVYFEKCGRPLPPNLRCISSLPTRGPRPPEPMRPEPPVTLQAHAAIPVISWWGGCGRFRSTSNPCLIARPGSSRPGGGECGI